MYDKKFSELLAIFYVFLTLLSASSFCHAEKLSNFHPNEYFLSLKRTQGRTVGNKLSYTSIDALAFPFHDSTVWPFLDFRVHRFDKKNRYAGNFGLGCRYSRPFTDQIFGVNVYYDFRNARHANFNQIGLGFELLGKCWNLRVNGYLPIGKKRILNSFCLFDDFIGSFFMLRKNYRKSLKGLDFELESYLTNICCMDFYLGIGAYYYKEDRCHKDIYGAEYRLSTWYCDSISFSINATHDCHFKTRIQGELCITFPFKSCCTEDRRLFLPVWRREIIALDKTSRWDSNFGSSGVSCSN